MRVLAYRFFLPAIVATLLGLALPMSQSMAQDLVNVYWDFRTSDYGAETVPYSGYISPAIVPGAGCALTNTDFPTFTYSAGVGFDAGYYEFWPGHCGGRFGRLKLPDDIDLRHIDMQDFVIYWTGTDAVSFRIADGTWPGSVSCCSLLVGESGRGDYRVGWTQNPPIDNLRNLEIEMADYNGAAYQITGIAFSYYPNDDDDDPPPPTLTMPLKSDDLHPDWGMYDYAYVNSIDSDWPDEDSREPVYAYSDKLNASVHAVAAGTVTAVDPDITSQCQTLDESVPGASHSCFVIVPAAIAGEALSQAFTIQMPRTSLVLVKDDEDPNTIYTYFVSDVKVAVGDHLEPGCIIGETIPLYNAPGHVGSIDLGIQLGGDSASIGGGLNDAGFNTIQTGKSVTVVRKDNLEPEITRLYPELTVEPDESACSNGLGACLNGASSALLSLNGWVYSDGVTTLSGGGASLPGGSQIYQTNNMTLDDSTDYTMTVQARSTTTGNGFDVVNRIKLFIGETVEQFPITTQWETFSIEFIGEDMFSGDAYGVVNQNAADVGIEIRYICVSGEGASQTPNSCYFKNHHFDDGPTDWVIDGGVTFQSGQAFTYNDSTLEQSVMLYPLTGGGDATYNLTVAGRLIATSAYTGQSGKYVDLSYRFPMSGDYTLIDEIDSSMVQAEGTNVYSGTVDLEHTYVLTIPITISSYTTSLFSIKTNVTDGDNYLLGFRVDYACLQSASTDDGSFPGQGGAGFDPPFYENCEVVATPEDNNISSWTYYHWSNLKRFFDCTLMVKLNSMAQLMDSAWKTSRLFFRWIVATGQMSGRWLSTQVFPWLNGQFRNIAFGQVTTVYQEGGGSCNDLFCVLNNLITGLLAPITSIVNTLLSLLTVGVNLLLTVITGIIGLALAFLVRLLGLFNQATGLLGGILNAYNTATPTAIDGLPMCNVDPTSSLFCRGTWLLDNTILSGRWGILFTLIIGMAGIHLILWVIGEFKTAIVTTGSGS